MTLSFGGVALQQAETAQLILLWWFEIDVAAVTSPVALLNPVFKPHENLGVLKLD